ncbi:MAG: alpha-amylase/4-alpha-glucanotransferase domain-containing protein [Denitratisoma sp.]|nr:alpha-amylase/4-alpha-glucanotransferase domain-containing protein [Denitratisoma sp.]
MTQPVSLLLGVHAHQPVGNFSSVLEEAHERCYRPFLRTLHRYPQFRFAAHFSGWLLDWLLAQHPLDMALLKEMVARGQVELFGAGDCEPVLASIPQRDRIGQLSVLSDKLQRRFGARVEGAWLTERVYIPTVVPALADCSMKYVTVDDYHFLCTGKAADELDGFYTTEEDGRTIDLFPISEQLRYRLPFSPAAEAVAYLEGLAREGHQAAVYFDDIEKFGIWPETYEWVYEKGWLEQFIEGVLASPLIRTETYSAFHSRSTTRGIIYLPTTSYIEMNEWALPARAAAVYDEVVEREKREGRYERTKPFVRGGIWKNFFMRYPESNWMHKRMLGLSDRLAALPPGGRTVALTEHLYRAQANDAYWHGLFGGLYLPHLRREVFSNLLALEAALDAVAPRPPLAVGDADYDGVRELFLGNADVQAVVKLDAHAALCELDAYGLAQNFGDVLTQRAEHYYHKLEAAPQAKQEAAGIASAHDRVAFKDVIGAADVVPDARPRRLFLDAWRRPDGKTVWPEYAAGAFKAPLMSAAFGAALDGGEVTKTLTLAGRALQVAYRLRNVPGGRFSVELNLAMPSCDGYSGRYILADGSIPCGFGQALDLAASQRLTLDDRFLGGGLRLTASRPVDISGRPHYTVSQSEAGFEKIMQAVCLTLSWPVDAVLQELTFALEILADK